jgi:hypothetical protein
LQATAANYTLALAALGGATQIGSSLFPSLGKGKSGVVYTKALRKGCLKGKKYIFVL